LSKSKNVSAAKRHFCRTELGGAGNRSGGVRRGQLRPRLAQRAARWCWSGHFDHGGWRNRGCGRWIATSTARGLAQPDQQVPGRRPGPPGLGAAASTTAAMGIFCSSHLFRDQPPGAACTQPELVGAGAGSAPLALQVQARCRCG
jgi:hypothetical protein